MQTVPSYRIGRGRRLVALAGAGAAMALLGGAAKPKAAETRILLRPDMVLNETAIGDATLLVDEQNAIGDPSAGKGVRPEHPFFPGWTAWQYPVQVVIDLGALPAFDTPVSLQRDRREQSDALDGPTARLEESGGRSERVPGVARVPTEYRHPLSAPDSDASYLSARDGPLWRRTGAEDPSPHTARSHLTATDDGSVHRHQRLYR